MDFNKLQLSKEIKEAIFDLGYRETTSVQEKVIPEK